MREVVLHLYRFGNVVVDVSKHQLTVGDKPRRLEPKSLRLLVYLIENRGRAISKEELLKEIWADTFVTDNALTRAVTQVRKALEDDPKAPRYIETIPTVGYRFVAELIAEPDETVALEPKRKSDRSGKLWYVTGFSLLLCGTVWWRLAQHSVPNDLRLTDGVQFTAGSGLDICPAFSPDGRWVAYASDRSGSFRIYVRGTGESEREFAVTSGEEQNLYPAFSPDSRWIAFSNLGRAGIFRVPLLGGAVRRLSEFGAQPVWSPDGQWIVFRSEEPASVATTDQYAPATSSLWLMNAEGGELRQLTLAENEGGGQAYPTWSTDSKSIRYIRFRGGLFEACTVDIRKGQHKVLFASPDGGGFGSAIYTKDDRWMLYVSSRPNGEVGIWALPLNPKTLKPVGPPQPLYRPNIGVPRDLAITSDGRQVAYTATVPESRLDVISLDSGQMHSLTHDAAYRFLKPRWNPDDKAVVAVRAPKSRLPQLISLSYPDGQVTEVAPAQEVQVYPQFSSDGKYLYYETFYRQKQTIDLKRLAWPDGIPQVMSSLPSAFSNPTVAPDHSNAVFQSAPAMMRLWRIDFKTAASRQITFNRESTGYAIYSHNGQWLCFESMPIGASNLMVMPSHGTQTEQVIAQGTYYAGSWSPDDGKIAYARLEHGLWDLGFVDVKSRERRTLTANKLARVYYRYPDWSHDGKRLVFEFNETRGTLFLADLR